jgi:hypothetical protein
LNRLTSIDRDNALPVETLNGLKTHMDTMNRLIIERYHRRNRFVLAVRHGRLDRRQLAFAESRDRSRKAARQGRGAVVSLINAIRRCR